MAGGLSVDVEKRYSTGTVVTATFQTATTPGEVFVLFGPSGSGKTTVLRSIAGLDRPDRGAISFAGETWVDQSQGVFRPPQSRAAAYVSQDPALFPHLSVRDNVSYGIGGLPAAARDARMREVAALLDLDGLFDRLPRQMSGGQAQRVAIGRALVRRPGLLLLDEPFAALDEPTRAALGRALRVSIKQLGIAVVLVTHDRSDALSLGDQIAVLAGGRIRQVGPVLDVFRRPADRIVAEAVGVESVLAGIVECAEDGLVDVRVENGMLRAVDIGLTAGQRQVLVCIRAEDVTLERGAGPTASTRNRLTGRIVSVDPEGPVERVVVDCGFPLAALVTRQAREEMDLKPGAPIVAAIKATAIHLVARS